ncbi:MAG: MBL fold metallo-hydrolase [Saprospiraceae bacterium]|nr:MBL fold metallo-hydrolase [Saprospiraceae bacterium]
MKIVHQDKNVLVLQSALFQTNSTIVETNDLILLVDPNWLPREIAEIQLHILDRMKATQKPVWLLFTHSDYDHIIGYNAFSALVEGVIASRAFVENMEQVSILEQIKQFDDEYYITRGYPIEYPSVSYIVENDEQVLTIGQTKLTFWTASGHNPDGIFTLVNQTLILGDYLCDVEFPYIYYSSWAYQESLNKIEHISQNYDIQVFINGHGNPTTKKKEIIRRKEEALEYIGNVRGSIRADKYFDFDKYIIQKGFQYPRIMRRFHEGNLNLMRQEEFG